MGLFEVFGAVTYSLRFALTFAHQNRFAFIRVYSTFELLPIVSYLHTLPSLETQAFPSYARQFFAIKYTLKWGSKATHVLSPSSSRLWCATVSTPTSTLTRCSRVCRAPLNSPTSVAGWGRRYTGRHCSGLHTFYEKFIGCFLLWSKKCALLVAHSYV